MTTVYVPTLMRALTNGQAIVKATGHTVGQLFENLETQFPGIQKHLYDQQGLLNLYIAVFVNNQSIRDLRLLETPLQDRDEVHIIPAIAGG